MSATEAELQQRIAALEAYVAMMRDGVVPSGDLTARAFYLMDDTSRRAAIEPTEDGVSFRQFDSEGRTRIAMGVNPKDVAQLVMTDPAGEVRIALVVEPNGSPLVRLHDAEGTTRLQLTVAPDGTPQVMLLDAERRPRIFIGISAKGEPAIVKLGADGNEVP